jgi:hypothetical protein
MYDQQASAYCKGAIFIWCISGLIYAGTQWHVLWLPGILLFLPGIFIASLIATAFFIPFWLIMKKVLTDWDVYKKNWLRLVLATLLKGMGLIT